MITDAPNGVGRVDLAAADTAALTEGDYYQELQITLGGFVTTVLFGIITLKKDIVP